ncbi:MAG TPA: alanine dehydrogenase [Longimicrobiales bacterium]|nr:alanine dehydrogenase [Longimicrobiales bacterium]
MIMIIGVPKEIKTNENRIALVPGGAQAFVDAGHTVLIEKDAGEGSGFENVAYQEAGAQIVDSAADVWKQADMIMKVKEPIASEYAHMRKDQIIFTYFHFAASEELTRATVDSGAIGIAYETVQLPSGELPLLTPMSEVAGRMSVQEGAKYLEKFFGGRGMLLGGVPGVEPANVLVIGGGIVGTNAAKMAAGLGARVTIMDVSLPRLRYLADVMPKNVTPLYSNRGNLLEHLAKSDLVIGAVLVPGKKAPRLVTREDLAIMPKGAVVVDVAVDQGGCIETIKPTTHENPIYEVDGIVHYGVANMPGAVPRTSTMALTNATLPYALSIAGQGWRPAVRADRSLALGVNVVSGKITYAGVAEAFDMPHTSLESVL